MRWRICKRLLGGWLILGFLLGLPASVQAQYDYWYYDVVPEYGDGDDDFELWELALIGLLVFLPAVQGCVLNQQWDSDFP